MRDATLSLSLISSTDDLFLLFPPLTRSRYQETSLKKGLESLCTILMKLILGGDLMTKLYSFSAPSCMVAAPSTLALPGAGAGVLVVGSTTSSAAPSSTPLPSLRAAEASSAAFFLPLPLNLTLGKEDAFF